MLNNLEGTFMADTNNQVINGNLSVDNQIQAKELKIIDDDLNTIFTTSGKSISFRKACRFEKPVEFNDG